MKQKKLKTKQHLTQNQKTVTAWNDKNPTTVTWWHADDRVQMVPRPLMKTGDSANQTANLQGKFFQQAVALATQPPPCAAEDQYTNVFMPPHLKHCCHFITAPTMFWFSYSDPGGKSSVPTFNPLKMYLSSHPVTACLMNLSGILRSCKLQSGAALLAALLAAVVKLAVSASLVQGVMYTHAELA